MRRRRAGARLVDKATLLRQSDWLTVHLVLSQRSRGIIGAADLAQMKPTAWLVNTSRGPLVDEAALVDALECRAIAGAALDVFDKEPLPERHPFRSLPNVVTSAAYRLRYHKDLCDILHGHGGELDRLAGWGADPG